MTLKLAEYKKFVDAFTKSHPHLTRSTCHFNAEVQWKKIKHNDEAIRSNIEKYRSMIKRKSSNDETTKRKLSLSSDDEFEPYDSDLETEKVPTVEPTFHLRDNALKTEFNDVNKPWVRLSLERAHARAEARKAKLEARRLASQNRVRQPVQEAVIQQIKEITERIDSLVQVKNMGLSTAESSNTLKKLLEQKKDRLAELSRLQSKQRAATRYRIRKKHCMETICQTDPEVAAKLLRFYKPTLLRVQIDNICPELLETLEEIARLCGAADNNPRLINTPPCASLDELREKIRERGYEIRRTTDFYRLIPARAFMEDGKRHVGSQLVRMRKLQDVRQAIHPDTHFTNATLRHVKDLAGTFGNECVFYLVEDRKASVRIGRALTREYSPLILHLDYQNSSIDSGPIPRVDASHLKPVVYASCIIDEAGLVTFEGPTYVSIRSQKYDRFTTDSEDTDLDVVVKLREFEKTARNHIGAIKPIFIMNVDTLEPMDFTRYPKNLLSAIGKFKRYNLDALFIVANAPAQPSANIIERRLAILSQDLTGLVLPYDYFGKHLNLGGFTIDADLERTNLKKTGEVLAEIWSMDKIDGQQVVAQFIDPPTLSEEMTRIVDCRLTLNKILDEICDDEEEEIPLDQRAEQCRILPPEISTIDTGKRASYNIDEYWCATHVFQTQYTIQIVRCTKPECCGPWRSNYIQLFPHRFLPSPVPFHRSSRGVRLVDVETSSADRNPQSPYYGTLYQRIQFHGIVIENVQNPLIPYDAFCPSLQNKLHLRICSICKQYIPLASRLRNHYRVHQQRYASCLTSKIEETNKKEDESTDDPDPIDPAETPFIQVNPTEKSVFLFPTLTEWLKPDFEQVPVTPAKTKSTVTIANEMIRKERQLQALANLKEQKIDPTSGLVESVATISLDNALANNEDNIQIVSVKSEGAADDSIDENENNDDDVILDEQQNKTISDDDLLEQYDDLNDLLDKI